MHTLREVQQRFVEAQAKLDQLRRLAKEYRPSMDPEVLHDWAKEVVAAAG